MTSIEIGNALKEIRKNEKKLERLNAQISETTSALANARSALKTGLSSELGEDGDE